MADDVEPMLASRQIRYPVAPRVPIGQRADAMFLVANDVGLGRPGGTRSIQRGADAAGLGRHYEALRIRASQR